MPYPAAHTYMYIDNICEYPPPPPPPTPFLAYPY